VASLRADCVRTGVREVTVAKGIARLSPLDLKVSQAMRLKRLHPKAIYKEDLDQVLVPVRPGSEVATTLVTFLQEMVPVEEPSVASTAP
jgi:hypothetical protein